MTDLSGKITETNKELAKYFGVSEVIIGLAKMQGAETYQDIYYFIQNEKRRYGGSK